MGEQADDEDHGHEAARRLVPLHRDVAGPQPGDRLAVHGHHPRSRVGPGCHGGFDGYGVRGAVGREDGHAVEADVD